MSAVLAGTSRAVTPPPAPLPPLPGLNPAGPGAGLGMAPLLPLPVDAARICSSAACCGTLRPLLPGTPDGVRPRRGLVRSRAAPWRCPSCGVAPLARAP